MIDASHVPDEQLGQTKRLVCKEMLSRGWRVWFYDEGYAFIRIDRGDGKYLELYDSVSPLTTFSAGMCANNKIATQNLYAEAGLPVPKTWYIRQNDTISDEALQLMHDGTSLVVKPLDAAHGNGVRVNIKTPVALDAALSNARKYSQNVLIQECIEQAHDVRLLCIDYKCIAALERSPASVTGDGVSTVEQLIQKENKSENRGENYKKDLNIIPIDLARDYLGSQMNDVPAEGIPVQVVGTANVGTGGTTRDVTDEVPQWLCEMAEKAARVSQLACCGVDFLLQGEISPSETDDSLRATIIEVNKSPALFMHDRPIHGTPRPAISSFVDHLASITL